MILFKVKHAQIQKVLPDILFFVRGGERIQLKDWPTSETPFEWCFAGWPIMAQH